MPTVSEWTLREWREWFEGLPVSGARAAAAANVIAAARVLCDTYGRMHASDDTFYALKDALDAWDAAGKEEA